jgi:mono/diheme cytochrome c family protein
METSAMRSRIGEGAMGGAAESSPRAAHAGNYIFGEFMFKVFAATFLFFGTLCSFPTAQAQTPAAPKGAGNAHVGEEVFTKRCFQCHSVIEGQVRFGPSLFGVMKGPHPRKTAPEIRTILKDGKNKMPPFKDILTEEDTDNLLAYLHTL